MELVLYTAFPKEIKEEWNNLLEHCDVHVPFLRYEYLSNWWSTRGGGEWPEAELVLVTAREGERLVGIAPLFKTQWDGRSALLLLGSIQISDYLDVITRREDLPAFLEVLLPFLAENVKDWEALDLYNFLESSVTPSALQKSAEWLGWKFSEKILEHAPFITLPGDWETYLAGIDKKQRHEIRRKMRRAEESPEPIRWYRVEDEESLDREMDDFLNLMRNDAEKVEFLTDAMSEQMRRTARCAFEGGCLNLSFLVVGGQKAAGYLSFQYLNRLWVYNSGLNPAFGAYSPGWVLLGNLIQWAIVQQMNELDFMRGEEQYKYRFGAVDRFIKRVIVTRN